MFKRVSFYLALAGIVFAVGLVRRQKAFEPPSTPLVEPSSAPYAQTIGARGLVEGVNENVRISPTVPGLVVTVPVKVGDEVRTGDVLIELDARDADAQVRVQEANLVAIDAALKEAQVALADREDQWRRVEKLGENRVVSEDEKQRTLYALRGAQSRADSKKAELEASRALLERAKVQRELLVVRAPQDGTVLQVNARVGEYIALNATERPMLIGQTKELQIRADVDEDNAPRVRPNCEALAYVKGQRDAAIPLRFVRIEPYILPKKSLTGESSERVDTRVLQVIFRFERPQTPIYVGQQMDVFLKGE
ncbi:MAG: biotin/lipoyl-binding protein [Verrucomicrobiota bacterium]